MIARYNFDDGPRNTRTERAGKRQSHHMRRWVRNILLLTLAGCEKVCPVEPDIPLDQDIAVQVGPAWVDIAQGNSGTFTVTIQRTGVTGPVALDLFSELPKGASISFNPATLPSGVTTSIATITLASDASLSSTSLGDNVVIRAKHGDLVRYGQFKFTAISSTKPGFTLNVVPGTFVVRPGQFAEGTVSIVRTGNYQGAITVATEGVPEGVTATVTSLQADTYRLRVEVASWVTPPKDQLEFNVRGNVTDNNVSNNGIRVGLTVANPLFLPRVLHEPRMRAGGEDTVTVLMGRSAGYTAPITLALDNLPAGITGTFDPNPAVDDASLLRLRVAASVAPGRHSVTVRANPPANTGATGQAFNIEFTVDPPLAANAFTINAPSLNVVTDSNASAAFSIVRGAGFTELIEVNLARSNNSTLPAGLSVTLDQNRFSGSATGTTIRASATSLTPPGNYGFVAIGVADGAIPVTQNFNVVVTARPVPTRIAIGKLVGGVPQATTSESITVSQTVQLRALVYDQNNQPMASEAVSWSSSHPVNVSVNPSGDAFGFGLGSATITATSNSNPSIKSSVLVTVVPTPSTSVVRMELEPGNGEITAPASQQYSVVLYAANDVRIAPEPGTTFSYSSSNPLRATVNDSTGVVKGVSAGNTTITVRYMKGGVLIREASAPLLVYAPGTAGHYGSAYISTNNNNTRYVKLSQPLLFQLYVFDTNGLQQPVGVTPDPVITASNPNVFITKSGITGGYFYTMTVGAGVPVGTTFKIRYDVTGAGGEIIMTVVP